MDRSAVSRAEEALADAELVRAMSRGERLALGALYDRHAGALLALAARIVGRGAEAEDLVHDVFLEAWRRAADFDAERGSVKAWLLLRTRSRALDLRKSARVARRSDGGGDDWVNEVPDPADRSLSPDRDRVRGVLARLPAEQRAVLLLGYFEGLSSSEIAEKLGIPIGTVKSRTAAALASLRAVLAERGEP